MDTNIKHGAEEGFIMEYGEAHPFNLSIRSPAGALESWLSMPEWYLALAALAPICALGFLWSPLFYALPLLGLALTRADFPSCGKRFARLLCSPSTIPLWPVQITQA